MIYSKRTAVILFLPLALGLFACKHEQLVSGAQSQPTLSNIQDSIFSPKCAQPGCHIPGGAGPMALRTAQESFNNLVNQPSEQLPAFMRVNPGNPTDSYLVMKLKDDPRIQFDRMPLLGNRLSDTEIALIEEWITTGAENN